MPNPLSPLNKILKATRRAEPVVDLAPKAAPTSAPVVVAPPAAAPAAVVPPVDPARREALKRMGAQSMLNATPAGALAKVAADPVAADVVKLAPTKLSPTDKHVLDGTWWSIGESIDADQLSPTTVNSFFTDLYKEAEPRLKAPQRRALLDALKTHADEKSMSDPLNAWLDLHSEFNDAVKSITPQQLFRLHDKHLPTPKFSDMTIPELREWIDINVEEATGDTLSKSALDKAVKRLRGE